MVISHAYESATDADCNAIKVEAPQNTEDWYFPSLQEELCSPVSFESRYMVLPDDLFCFYLRDVTHRYMDTFSIGPVLGAQEV